MDRFEDRLTGKIIGLVNEVGREVAENLFPNLDAIVAEAAQDQAVVVVKPMIRQDDAAARIGRTFRDLTVFAEQFLPDSRIAILADRFAADVNNVNRDFNDQNVKTILGVDVFTPEPWLIPEIEAFTAENVSLIQGVTSEQISDIEQAVQRLVRRGASATEIRNEIQSIMESTRARAKLIGRDQTAKFNGRLTELRQKQLGVEKYKWRTADDERVRSSHAALDDTTQRWDSPPVTVTSGKRAGERNHPGQDIQCRCIAEAIFVDERGREIA